MRTHRSFTAEYNSTTGTFLYSEMPGHVSLQHPGSQGPDNQKTGIDDIVSKLNNIALKTRYRFLLLNGLSFLSISLTIIFFSALKLIIMEILTAFTLNTVLFILSKRSHLHIKYIMPDHYNFFPTLGTALKGLKDSSKLVQITQRSPNRQYARYAGLKTVYNRLPLKIKQTTPRQLSANIAVLSMQFSNSTIYFFPDFVLLDFNNRYVPVPYRLLSLRYAEHIYHEFEDVPDDGTITGSTWLHPRKDGKPDRRFRYNTIIPKILYSEITIIIAGCLQFEIQASNIKNARAFVSDLGPFCKNARIKQKQSGKKTRQKKEEKTGKKNNFGQQQTTGTGERELVIAYRIMGLLPSATPLEVKNRYRLLIKKYHPDIFATRGEKYIQAAQEKMKQINLAYEKVSSGERPDRKQ